MKKSLILVLLIATMLLASCSSGDIIDAETFITAFEDEGLAISDVEHYTSESDPNELLGRPGEYAQKVSFTFTGTEKVEYCTIEIFKKEKHAVNRENYINEIIENIPSIKQYIIRNSSYVMRFDLAVTPSEAEQFENAFNNLIGIQE